MHSINVGQYNLSGLSSPPFFPPLSSPVTLIPSAPPSPPAPQYSQGEETKDGKEKGMGYNRRQRHSERSLVFS